MVTGTTRILALMTLFALFIQACTASEIADDDERAEAVEPTAEAADTEESTAAVQSLDDREFDVEALSEAGEDRGDDGATELLGSLGLMPQSRLCDGGPCARCEVGSESLFASEDADVVVHSCCDVEGCVNQWFFDDGDSAVVTIGELPEPAYFSPDGRYVVVQDRSISGAEAQDSGDSAVMVAELEALRDRAHPVDETPTMLVSADLKELATWTLGAEEIHRLEALSARAIQEGEEHCDQGVHLPTLIELSQDAVPITDLLRLKALRWTRDGELLLETTGEEPGFTSVEVAVDTECMQRFSTTEDWPEVALLTGADSEFAPEDFVAHAFPGGERGPGVLIRGLVYQHSHGPGGSKASDFEVSVYDGGDLVDDDDIVVARRRIAPAEIDWATRHRVSPRELADPRLDHPVTRDGDVNLIPVSIVVFAEAEELQIYLEP